MPVLPLSQETVIVPFMKLCTSQWYGNVPALVSVTVLGLSLFWKMPVSNDLSSAVKLCGVPSSRLLTVTFSPTFTVNLSGLNLKFWMATASDPALVALLVAVVSVGAVVAVADFLLDEPPPQAAAVSATAAAMA